MKRTSSPLPSAQEAAPDFDASLALAIIAHSDDAIVSKTLDGRVLSWNAGATSVFGYRAEEMLGESITRLIPQDRQSEELHFISRVQQGLTVSHFETQRIRKDGALIDVSVTLSPIRYKHGAIIAVSKIARDITEQRQWRAKLEQMRLDLDQVLEYSPVMVSLWDSDWTLRYANRAYARSHGLTPDGIRGRTVTEVLGPELNPTLKALIERAVRGERVSFERAVELPGGGMRHELVDYVPAIVQGGAKRLFVFVSDITRRKLAEQAAEQNAASYRDLYERTPAMVQSIDHDGRLLSVSDLWLSKLGYERNEVLGRQFTEFLTAESRELALTLNLPEFFRSEVANDFEYQMKRKDGTVIDVQLSAVTERDSAGNFLRSLAVIQDVTARNRALRALRENEELMDRAGRIAGVGGWSYIPQTQRLFWSEQTCRIHDLPPDHLPTVESAISFYTPDAQQRIAAAFRACAQDHVAYDLELPMLTAKGRSIWIRTAGEPEVVDGRVVRIFGAIQDITARKTAELEVARQHELMRVTMNSIGDAVITTDASGAIRWLNPVAEQLTGWPLGQASGRPIAEVFHTVQEEPRHPANHPSRKGSDPGAPGPAGATVLVSKDGKQIGIEDCTAPIRDEQGHTLGAVVVFHDVSEQRRLSREINYRASHDTLTGLLNRTEFEHRLGRAFGGARDQGQSHTLLYIDLDQFKVVNDNCGHAAGDKLLREVAGLLSAIIRAGDTLARLGGDEFGVLMEHCTASQARRVADQLCERMEEFRFIHEDQRFRIGASVGLVPMDARWNNAAEIMQAADAACYAAKEAGRNRVHEWVDSDSSIQNRHGEMQWATRIERAIDEQRLRLYAQKIGRCDSAGSGLHFEVLLRMMEPDGTIIGPGAFLPAAERFNLASRLDRWVLHEVLAWMAGRDLSDVAMVAINLSGQSMGDRSFHRDAEELVAQSSVDPRKICLEITETAAIAHLGDAQMFIARMRTLGVKIALDDFGAGMSSFGYLKSLPVDLLKIDGQFVRDILQDKLDHTAVCCFRDVAAVCGLQTIAEHVETEAVFTELGRIGIDFAQGYLVHKPEPIDRLAVPPRGQSSRSSN